MTNLNLKINSYNVLVIYKKVILYEKADFLKPIYMQKTKKHISIHRS